MPASCSSFSHKKILVRVDMNVPLKDGFVRDDFRLKSIVPTLKMLLQQKARIILLSHLGRPKGIDHTLSLKPVVARLQDLLPDTPIDFATDTIGPDAYRKAQKLQDGHILVLENVRFHAEELQNSQEFAEKLSQLGDAYLNDAFATAHRAHASVDAITHYLPSSPGPLLEKELATLDALLNPPIRPFLAIIGGAKISSKLSLLSALLPQVDCLAIVGGMAHTFLKANGVDVGNSLAENAMIPMAKDLYTQYKDKILLPEDVVIANAIDAPTHIAHIDIGTAIGENMILDIGPKTCRTICTAMAQAKTIIWNGAPGVSEVPAFAEGTRDIAQHLAQWTRDKNIISIVGGGDTVGALRDLGLEDQITYLSTGGGAFLEWLEGKTLPGIAALQKKRT